jgi:predicted ribosome quality control (RQC) complex YloA/Tae2 family protein
VLAISYARERYLVAVLETPGPFCFLAHFNPFQDAHAPVRMERLSGAEVQDVSCPDGNRVLKIDVVTRAREHLTLSIVLFGSAGAAFVARDGVPAESVGRGSLRIGDVPESVAEAEPATPPFRLVITGRDGAGAPAGPDTARRASADGARVLGPFSSALHACETLGQRVLDGAHETIIRRVTRPARRKVDSLRRLITNLEADIATADGHDEERRIAEALAAYQTRIPPGATHIDLPDLYHPERIIAVELDPTDSIHIQIEKRFRRVAKLEKSLAHSHRRLALIQKESEELEASLRLLANARTFTEALKLVEAIRAKFSLRLDDKAPPVGGIPRKQEKKTYRQFELDATWFVIVGRSNKENDEITFNVAASTDLWFHAHNVPGSHVILKSRGGKDGAPAAIIQQAASIAAHFSKARHSGLVPVIYTQRKYVRKVRGANPGQVTCEREKMLMVPPQLPNGEEES